METKPAPQTCTLTGLIAGETCPSAHFSRGDTVFFLFSPLLFSVCSDKRNMAFLAFAGFFCKAVCVGIILGFGEDEEIRREHSVFQPAGVFLSAVVLVAIMCTVADGLK